MCVQRVEACESLKTSCCIWYYDKITKEMKTYNIFEVSELVMTMISSSITKFVTIRIRLHGNKDENEDKPF